MKAVPRKAALTPILLLLLTVDSGAFWDANFQPSFDAPVNAIVVGQGGFYVGGYFSKIAGVSANYIAHWNGTNWLPLDSGVDGGVFPSVLALAIHQGDLFVGGTFTTAGGKQANNIARWDGANWHSLGSGVNGIVRALVSDGQNLFVGGSFTQAGDLGVTNIAIWKSMSWLSPGGGIPGVAVDSLSSNGTNVYAGGRFQIGGATNVAAWSGSQWRNLGNGISGQVRAMAVSHNGLFVAGNFTRAGDASATNVARWDGFNWAALGGGVTDGREANSITVNGNTVYLGGNFQMVGGINANKIASWDGERWHELDDGVRRGKTGGAVWALTANGAELLVGGYFDFAGGNAATNLALWNIPHALNANPAEDSVTLSWPATGTNFVLEAKESLAAPNWSVVSTNPALVGDECRVTNQINSPARFFRLRRK